MATEKETVVAFVNSFCAKKKIVGSKNSFSIEEGFCFLQKFDVFFVKDVSFMKRKNEYNGREERGGYHEEK